MTGGGSPSLVVPLVEDNGCRKIKVAVLLQWATPSLLFIVSLLLLPRLHAVDLLVLCLFCPLVGDVWGAPAFLADKIKTKKQQNKLNKL